MRAARFAPLVPLAASSLASAQFQEGVERVDDAYVPIVDPVTTPAGRFESAIGVAVQANTDGDGMNIVNDAANEPSLAVDPTAPNRIAIGWRQFDTIASNFRQAGWSWSIDGGRTWSGTQVYQPGVFRSDPVLDAAPDGTFYYSSLRIDPGTQIDFLISDDAGRTWSQEVFAFGGDKQWYAIDKTGGSATGSIYHSWNTAGNPYFPAQFNRSLDAGQSFTEPQQFLNAGGTSVGQPVFGDLEIDSTGRVYIVGQRNSVNTDRFWVVWSDDAQSVPASDEATFAGGNTNTVGNIDFGGTIVFASAPNPGGLLSMTQLGVDRSGGPRDGWVYAASAISPTGTGASSDVHFVRSTDCGLTWSAAAPIHTPGVPERYRWFVTMDVAPDGRIDIVYNDTEGQPARTSRTFYQFSTDGGDTWSVPEPLTPEWDSWVGWPSQNKIGDYYDIVSDNVGAHLAFSTTFNGEQDVYYLRIGDYDCDGNGIGDTDDLASGALADCDADGIPDSCEIAAGAENDLDSDGIPTACEPCRGDVTGEGLLNTNDFFAFLALFQAGDDRADLDASGAVNTNDFFAYLALFQAGC